MMKRVCMFVIFSACITCARAFPLDIRCSSSIAESNDIAGYYRVLAPLYVNCSVILRVASNSSATLDGGGTSRLFVIKLNSTLTLIGLTLRNGMAARGGTAFVERGGSLFIRDSIIDGSRSTGFGGLCLHCAPQIDTLHLYLTLT